MSNELDQVWQEVAELRSAVEAIADKQAKLESAILQLQKQNANLEEKTGELDQRMRFT